jgi:hypothetical protein
MFLSKRKIASSMPACGQSIDLRILLFGEDLMSHDLTCRPIMVYPPRPEAPIMAGDAIYSDHKILHLKGVI